MNKITTHTFLQRRGLLLCLVVSLLSSAVFAEEVHAPRKDLKQMAEDHDSYWNGYNRLSRYSTANVSFGLSVHKPKDTTGVFYHLGISYLIDQNFSIGVVAMAGKFPYSSTLFYFGANLDWHKPGKLEGVWIQLQGGTFIGSGIQSPLPSANGTAGWRFHSESMLGSFGLGLGPEVYFASELAFGALLKVDVGIDF